MAAQGHRRRKYLWNKRALMTLTGGGGAMHPVMTTGIPRNQMVRQESLTAEVIQPFVRLPRGLPLTIAAVPRPPKPTLVSVEEPVPYAGALHLGRSKNIIGDFGDVNPTQLLWHVDMNYRVWYDFAGTMPAINSYGIQRVDDLTNNGNNLLLVLSGAGPFNQNDYDNATDYQVNATPTHKNDLQCNLRSPHNVLQGNFNFFTKLGQLTYAFCWRSCSDNGAFINDGTPGLNGFAFGQGTTALENETGALDVIGIKDGSSGSELAGFGASQLQTGGPTQTLIVTYDGQNSGKTDYYLLRADAIQSYRIVHGTVYNNPGKDATGGFAVWGTPNFSAARPGGVTNLTLCEAAIWQGIFTMGQITALADIQVPFWGYQ